MGRSQMAGGHILDQHQHDQRKGQKAAEKNQLNWRDICAQDLNHDIVGGENRIGKQGKQGGFDVHVKSLIYAGLTGSASG